MENPYKPPDDSAALTPKRKFYLGGFLAIGTLGVAMGILVGLWMDSLEPTTSHIPPILPGAVGWSVAISVMVAMIERASLKASQRIVLAMCLPLPCYILFIPVCMCVPNFRPPLASIWVVACGLAFPLVLLWIAVVVKSLVRWQSGESE